MTTEEVKENGEIKPPPLNPEQKQLVGKLTKAIEKLRRTKPKEMALLDAWIRSMLNGVEGAKAEAYAAGYGDGYKKKEEENKKEEV